MCPVESEGPRDCPGLWARGDGLYHESWDKFRIGKWGIRVSELEDKNPEMWGLVHASNVCICVPTSLLVAVHMEKCSLGTRWMIGARPHVCN